MSRVLVLGSGHLGGAVVRALGDHDVVHTWHRNERDLPGRGVRADLARPGGLDALFDTLGDWMPDHAIHCAGIPPSDAEDDAPWHIWPGTAAALGRRMSRGRGAPPPATPPGVAARNIVLFSALAPGQSYPAPPLFSAAQAGLAAVAMSLGHALGPKGFRVNVVALGILDGGTASAVSPEARAAYLRFAALRRVGTAAEAAATARWLLGNTALNGKVLSANGGI